MKRAKSVSYSHHHVSPFHDAALHRMPALDVVVAAKALPPRPSAGAHPLKGSSSLLDLRSFSRGPKFLRRLKSKDDDLFGCAGEMHGIDELEGVLPPNGRGDEIMVQARPIAARAQGSMFEQLGEALAISTDDLAAPAPPAYRPPPRFASLRSHEALRALERKKEEQEAAEACLTYIASHSEPNKCGQFTPGPLAFDKAALEAYRTRERSDSCVSISLTSESDGSSRPRTNESLPSYRSTASTSSNGSIDITASPERMSTKPAARVRPQGGAVISTGLRSPDVASKIRPYDFI